MVGEADSSLSARMKLYPSPLQAVCHYTGKPDMNALYTLNKSADEFTTRISGSRSFWDYIISKEN